jgi:hypothetical protein
MTLPATQTVWILNHRDANGDRITGETWVTTGCIGPDGAFTPVATEPYSDGRYRFTWSAASAGDYLFEAQAASAPTDPDAHFSAVVSVVDDLTASVSGYAAGTVGGSLAKINAINAGSITVTNPVAADQSVTLVQGDAYEGADALSWSNEAWSIPADATITLSATYAGQTVTFTGVRISATVVSVGLSADDTAALVAGRQLYRYRVSADSDVLVTGGMTVRAS